tara:strand:+ start:1113 stop:2504 length:1392 start_codon:yes stop_codon:yes gene_type:complete
MNEEVQLEFLKDLIRDVCENYNMQYTDISYLKSYIIDTMNMVFDNISYDMIDYNLNKFIKLSFKFDNSYQGKIIYNKENIIIPNEYKKLVDHIDFIANLPQPEQRTQEWFEMRKNMITASCAAQVIGENPYPKQTPDDLILDKLNLGPKFSDNKYVHHGKKYEEIATKIYEEIYNVKVNEYGLIPHISKPIIPFVGASPDGIASFQTLTNEFSPMIGRMLEIKCPYSREIITQGKIDGEICPHYYYCQVQQQLECCDLEYCDFWQCTIDEFYTKEEMLNDEKQLNYKEEQNQDIYVPINCRQGCIIQLLPKNKITQFCLFDAKYIYPKNINMSQYEYDQWLLDEITNLYKNHSNLMKDYVFDRILYWKITVCHNVKIKRDRDWWSKVVPKYNELWNKIVLYRNNKKELENFVKSYNDKYNKRKKKVIMKQEKFVSSESSEDYLDNKINKKPKTSDLFLDSDSD